MFMLTSSNEPFDIEKAYKYGANSDIVNSGDLDNFIEIIRRITLYWVKMNVTGAE